MYNCDLKITPKYCAIIGMARASRKNVFCGYSSYFLKQDTSDHTPPPPPHISIPLLIGQGASLDINNWLN